MTDSIAELRKELGEKGGFEGKSTDELMEENVRDPLTGAYNRRYMEEEIQRRINRGDDFSVMMFDIDKFGKINKTHGFLVGDQVLKAFSRELEMHIRPDQEAFVARLGGDEFVIVIPNIDRQSAESRSEGIIRDLSSKEYRTKGGMIPVAASGGVVVWDGKESLEELMDRVDRRMYEKKGVGR